MNENNKNKDEFDMEVSIEKDIEFHIIKFLIALDINLLFLRNITNED